MSPLQIEAVLRLYCRANPFAGMPLEQVRAPAMREAYQGFVRDGLLAEGVDYHSVYFGIAPFPFLSERGVDLVHRLCEVAP